MISGAWELRGSGISGWARSESGDTPVWLEVLADNEVVGIARADLPEPDDCGFWCALPAAVLADGSEISVRAANTAIFIPKAGATEAPEKESARNGLAGQLALDRGLYIYGWVCDGDRSDLKLSVAAYINDRKVAETVAAERRYRPPEADGHGYSLELPPEYADGDSHTVHLRDERNRELPGSPVRIRSLPQNAATWLKSQKKLDKRQLETVSGLLELMEERLPGAMSLSRYEHWKKAFPPEAPARRSRAFCGLMPGTQAAITGQAQGLDLRRNDSRADFLICAHPETRPHPHALALMYAALKDNGADLVFADSESSAGEPQFKPAWDREAFFARDYLGMFVCTPDLAARAGICAADTPEQTRLKLVLAAGENILHLPSVLSRDGAQDAAARKSALATWLQEAVEGAAIRDTGIAWPIRQKPLISVIIPTRDHADLLARCLKSLEQTSWPSYEILIVDNGTTSEEALSLLAGAAAQENTRVLRDEGVFNYARLNNEAVAQARGELICFLNNDTEALHPEWLTELARLLLAHEEAGAVGARLLWPNGLVQHAGVIVGTHQLAAHAGNSWLWDEPGYMNRNRIAQQYSAVTAACMLTRRDLFLGLGGFDERRFPVAFNDVDYCLRVRARGKKIYWTPESRLAHHESASRGKDSLPSARARSDREISFFRKLWGHYADPFYNPNLSLSALCEPFNGLAFPPRPRDARYATIRS